jgi:hypothetical protein
VKTARNTQNGRAANYTMDEDILLCITWKQIAMDAGVGIDQKFDTYWARMKEFFHSHNKSGYERIDIYLHSWWGVISMECQKLSAMLAGVDKVNPSGTNDQDRVIYFYLLFLFLLFLSFLAIPTCFLLVLSHVCRLPLRKTCSREKERRTRKERRCFGKPFTLHHYWKELEHCEKWKNRDVLQVPKASSKSSMGDAPILHVDDDTSSDDDGKRSPTPNSIAKTKRPIGRRQFKEKGRRAGDDEISKSLEAIVNVRKEMAEERKMARSLEKKENRLAEERKAVMDERMAAAQGRSTEQRKVAMEERKVAMEETLRLMEQEKIFFLHGYNQSR